MRFVSRTLKTSTLRRLGKSSGEIQLPKIGRVALRGWRSVGEIRYVAIARRAGLWFASVTWRRAADSQAVHVGPAVGLDVGVSLFAALSDGSVVAPVHHGKSALQYLVKAQRVLARKKKGSANRRKAVRRMARLHLRVRNARNDFLHKHSNGHRQEPRHGLCGGAEGQEHDRFSSRNGRAAGPECAPEGRPEPIHPRSRLGRVQADAGLQARRPWRGACGGRSGLHQPDVRTMRARSIRLAVKAKHGSCALGADTKPTPT